MEYIYAAMLLHKAGKTISEDAVKKILQAAGVTANDARVKALIASLEGLNIDEAIKKAVMPVAAAAVAAAPAEAKGKADDKKHEKSAEAEKKKEEEAAAGLGSLFG